MSASNKNPNLAAMFNLNSKKSKEKAMVEGVKFGSSESLPQGYDARELMHCLRQVEARGAIKAKKFNNNYMKVVDEYNKGDISQVIATGHTVLMESCKADFYQDISMAAKYLTNCDWNNSNNKNTPEIMRSAAMVCYCAAHESMGTFPDVIKAAHFLYMILGQGFKEQLMTNPYSLCSKSFCEKVFKSIPLRKVFEYVQLILSQYDIEFKIPEEIQARAEQIESEELQKNAQNAINEKESYPTMQNSSNANLPNVDDMSLMTSTVLPRGNNDDLKSVSTRNLPANSLSDLYNYNQAPAVPIFDNQPTGTIDGNFVPTSPMEVLDIDTLMQKIRNVCQNF